MTVFDSDLNSADAGKHTCDKRKLVLEHNVPLLRAYRKPGSRETLLAARFSCDNRIPFQRVVPGQAIQQAQNSDGYPRKHVESSIVAID